MNSQPPTLTHVPRPLPHTPASVPPPPCPVPRPSARLRSSRLAAPRPPPRPSPLAPAGRVPAPAPAGQEARPPQRRRAAGALLLPPPLARLLLLPAAGHAHLQQAGRAHKVGTARLGGWGAGWWRPHGKIRYMQIAVRLQMQRWHGGRPACFLHKQAGRAHRVGQVAVAQLQRQWYGQRASAGGTAGQGRARRQASAGHSCAGAG